MSVRRIIAAIFFTLAIMPCTGFFTFGFFASWEAPPGERWPWQLAYSVLGINSLAGIGIAWWLALRRVKIPGACSACGFSLKQNTSGKCPECGQAIKMRTGS